jgi:hypothetical protein
MSKEQEVALMPLVELPSGVCVRPDKIVFVARKELNQYVLFMEGVGAAPNVDGRDLDVLKRLGVVQALADPDKTEPNLLSHHQV